MNCLVQMYYTTEIDTFIKGFKFLGSSLEDLLCFSMGNSCIVNQME